ncbi:gag-pol polyprotein [Tanacetum coccineum]
MAARKDDSLQSFIVQLDGKKYSYWNYVMKKFLQGKSMWGYVSGTKTKFVDGLLVDNYAVLLDTWEVDNSKFALTEPPELSSLDPMLNGETHGVWFSILWHFVMTLRDWRGEAIDTLESATKQQHLSQPNNGVDAPSLDLTLLGQF